MRHGAAHHLLGLRAQLFGHATVLLRRACHARRRLLDLLHRGDDFGEAAGCAFRDRFDAAHLRLAHRHRRGDLFDLFADHAGGARDVFGGARRLVRQLAHLFGDDREPPAVFAGARRFDGGVQRQQVGLR